MPEENRGPWSKKFENRCFITSTCTDTDRMTSAASCQQLVSKKISQQQGIPGI